MEKKKQAEILKLIGLYRQHECLWNTYSSSYRRNDLKKKAYEEIAQELKTCEESIKRRIKNLRGTYVQEKKKVDQSKKSGSGAESVYQSSLYWFEEMNFLDASIATRKSKNNFADQPLTAPCKKLKRDEQRHRTQGKMLFQHRQEKLIEQQKDRISELMQQHQSKKQQIIPKKSIGTVPRTRNDDETTTISTAWGILYRDLEPRQKLYANKAITEVLYQGALGKLHEYSYKAIESQQITMNKVENPLEITIDRISYNDPEYQARDQIANISDALNYLKPLEEYAVRENHAAMGLISQLEDTLRNLSEDTECYKYE